MSNEDFIHLASKFENFHRHLGNIALHFLTSPLGILGSLIIFKSFIKFSLLVPALVYLYILFLASLVPIGVFVGTLLVFIGVAIFSHYSNLGGWFGIAILVGCYFAQDASHYLFSEATFQSSYSTNTYQVVAIYVIVSMMNCFLNMNDLTVTRIW